MKYTKNLKLPIFDNPSEDLFKVSDWNEANENIESTVTEVKDWKDNMVSADPIAEIIDARCGEKILGDKIRKIDVTLNEKVNNVNQELETISKDVIGAINEINRKPSGGSGSSLNEPVYISKSLSTVSDLESKKVFFYYDLYDDLVSKYPHVLTSSTLGKDQSNTFDIKQYIYTPSSGFNKTVLITSGIHGDEKAYSYLIYEMLKLILLDKENSFYFKNVRDNTRFVIIPVCNPWGIENNKRQNSRNVDINRNFDYRWNEQPSDSSSSTGNRYKGTSPFSELETQYIRNTMNNYNFISYIDFHNFVNVNQDGYVMYYSNETENISREIVSLMKKYIDEKASFYLSNEDSCSANYAYFIKKMPSMTLEGVRTSGSVCDADNLNKFMTLGFNHLIYYSNISHVTNNTVSNISLDNINYENTDNSTDVFSKSKDLKKCSDKYDKTFNFNKNGVLIINGVVNVKVISNSSTDVSNRSLAIDPKVFESGTEISNRMGAAFMSGSHSDVIPFNLAIPIKANTSYKFELWGCYDGADDTYVPYLKRVKTNFVFMS